MRLGISGTLLPDDVRGPDARDSANDALLGLYRRVYAVCAGTTRSIRRPTPTAVASVTS